MQGTATTELPRHTLVSVEPDAWAALLDSDPRLQGELLLQDWCRRDWPLIVRRRGAGERPDLLPLGLPLPPACGKKRIAVELPPETVRDVKPPPRLRDIAGTIDDIWQPTVAALLALETGPFAPTRVFGSFAWAALTGLGYTTAQSDLDLLWPASPGLPELLKHLLAIAERAPGRIDGEIEADGWVNWRELAGNAAEVLVKHRDGVRLADRRAFLSATASERCAS